MEMKGPIQALVNATCIPRFIGKGHRDRGATHKGPSSTSPSRSVHEQRAYLIPFLSMILSIPVSSSDLRCNLHLLTFMIVVSSLG